METSDLELLGYGIIIGAVLVYLVVKIGKDLWWAGAAMMTRLRGLVLGPRATPAGITDADSDPRFPGLPLRCFHVQDKKKMKTVHLSRDCSQFYSSTNVDQTPVCATCFRERRKQLGSREKED